MDPDQVASEKLTEMDLSCCEMGYIRVQPKLTLKAPRKKNVSENVVC